MFSQLIAVFDYLGGFLGLSGGEFVFSYIVLVFLFSLFYSIWRSCEHGDFF